MKLLDDLLEEFEDLDPQERLEQLIEHSADLPPLGPEQIVLRDTGACRVQECQTPVFLYVGVRDGRVELAAEVPEKSPTVRGFVALLVNGLQGVTPAEAAQLPQDLPQRLGLAEVLGMTRTRGFQGIISLIRQSIAVASAT